MRIPMSQYYESLEGTCGFPRKAKVNIYEELCHPFTRMWSPFLRISKIETPENDLCRSRERICRLKERVMEIEGMN